MLFLFSLGCSSTPSSSTSSAELSDSASVNETDSLDTADGIDSGDSLNDTASSIPSDTADTNIPSISYNLAAFKSTHNSYSGGERGSIYAQLDAGFRGLELDIHDNDFASLGDYQVGHLNPGDDVDHRNGNPSSLLLSAWLEHIKSWSSQHPNHAPITITLDLKDDLTDNIDFSHGSMDKLNDIFERTFGDRLYSPTHLDQAWPTIEELRNHFILVLSGHEESRQLYKRDRGYHPAISINSSGQVIEVHDSGSGSLWYWTGQLQTDNSIEWKRHGRYDSGQTPAIDINNQGWFVEVHQSESATTLWSRVGYLDENYVPIFGSSTQFDNGVQPSIRFDSKNGWTLREIHQSQSTGLHWDWNMTLNPQNSSLTLGNHIQTNDQLHDKDFDSALSWVEVQTASDRNAGNDTLLYITSTQRERIRYPQRAFIEYQHQNASELQDSELWFTAIGSGNQSTIAAWKQAGFITRQWGFQESDSMSTLTSPNFPATDNFNSTWYTQYCQQIGTVE